jgi:hypothetical protein
MFINGRILIVALVLLTSNSLILAQDSFTNEACLLLGYSQCVCTCSIPLLEQYCPNDLADANCACNSGPYNSGVDRCLSNAQCADIAGNTELANSVCAAYGLVRVTLAPASSPTGASGQSSGQGSTENNGRKAGIIAGIVIGSVAVLLIVIIGTVCIMQRRYKRKAATVSTPTEILSE